MKTGFSLLLAFAALACCGSPYAQAGEGEPPAVYVDQTNGTGPWDGTSWATAFCTVQEGLDASTPGATVWVAPGTYLENVTVPSREVTLSGSSPGDWNTVGATVIDGGQSGACITAAPCVPHASAFTLRGITLANGLTGFDSRDSCGEILIEYCDVQGNAGTGLSGSSVMRHVRVHGNTVGVSGRGTMSHSEIFSNSGDGAALEDFWEFSNNLVYDNGGNGVSGTWRAIEHCTIAYNGGYGVSAGVMQAGKCKCAWRGEVANCIVWGNTQGPLSGVNAFFSCADLSLVPGVSSVITTDPGFVDPDHHDFRLLPASRCIDAGMRNPWVADDFDGNSRPFNALVAPRGDGSDYDMGAYEYAEAADEPPAPEGEPNDVHQIAVQGDSDGDRLSDEEEAALGLDAVNPDQDGNRRDDGVDLALACAGAFDSLCDCPLAGWDMMVYGGGSIPRGEVESSGVSWICNFWVYLLEPECDYCRNACVLDGEIDEPHFAYNPCSSAWLDFPEGAYHFLVHGSFSSDGFLGPRRVDPRQAMRVLELSAQTILNLPQEGEFVPSCSTACEGEPEGAPEGEEQLEGQPEGEGESSEKTPGCGVTDSAAGDGQGDGGCFLAMCLLLAAASLRCTTPEKHPA